MQPVTPSDRRTTDEHHAPAGHRTTDEHRPAGEHHAPAAHRTYGELVTALAAAQKTTRGAPLYSRLVNRPLGRRLAALAHLAGATPDQVTAASAVATFAGIAAIALAPEGAWWWGVVVAAALVLGYALDAADGQLARLRGGGSVAGEWLDHVVDAAKIATIHLAVAVGAWRTGADAAWLLVPLGFSAVASTWFFTIILNDHLSRLAGGRDGQAAVAPPSRDAHDGHAGSDGRGRASAARWARSLAALPADYGLLCVVTVTLGWPALFRSLYTAVALGFLVITAASMVAWRRRIVTIATRPHRHSP